MTDEVDARATCIYKPAWTSGGKGEPERDIPLEEAKNEFIAAYGAGTVVDGIQLMIEFEGRKILSSLYNVLKLTPEAFRRWRRGEEAKVGFRELGFDPFEKTQ